MRTRLKPALARPIALAATLVLLSGCGDAAGPTAPQLRPGQPLLDRVIDNGEKPFTREWVYDCDGTALAAEGAGKITFDLRVDESGGTHFNGHIQMTLTGQTAIPPMVFTGSSTGSESLQVPGPTFTTTLVTKGTLKAISGSTSYNVHETFHITRNADGVLTAFVLNTHCH